MGLFGFSSKPVLYKVDIDRQGVFKGWYFTRIGTLRQKVYLSRKLGSTNEIDRVDINWTSSWNRFENVPDVRLFVIRLSKKEIKQIKGGQ